MKLELITIVRDHEVLYNTNKVEYRDATSRNEAWDKVAAQMPNTTVEECRTEWNKLRNCYISAINRRRVLLKRGKGPIQPWKYEEEMSFLRPFVYHRETKPRRKVTTLESVTKYESDDDITVEIEKLNEDEQDAAFSYMVEPKVERDDDFINMEDYLMNNDKEKVNAMDEMDLFFLGVSRTLKKLPAIEQCRLKMEVFTTVNKAEMKFLKGIKRKTSGKCSESE